MQLRVARLCHDCEEVHDSQQCPVCASETFTYITRWVPVPERRARPRQTSSPEAEVYRRLTSGETTTWTAGRIFQRAAIGLTAVGIAGWLWGRTKEDKRGMAPAAPEDARS
jgi:hypothetical protein